MRVISVSLVNFRGVQSGTLYYDKNEPFILLGPNGSCKSSYGVYSVPFCFWGYSPWKLENILRWGAKKGQVEVKFEIESKIYRAVRTFDDTSSKFRIYTENGKEDLGGGNNPENEAFFKKLFPVPKEVALQIMFKLQANALGSFCGETSAGKYNIIKKFIGIEKYETYRDKARQLIKRLEKTLDKLSGKIESSQNILEGVSYTDIEPKRNKLCELGRKKEKLSELIDEAKEQDKAIKEYKEAQKVLKKYPDIGEWYKKWQPLKTVKEPDTKYDEEKYKDMEDTISVNNARVNELEGIIKELEEEYKESSEELEKKQEEYQEVQDEIEDLEKQKKLLEKGKCPTCERNFRSTESRIEKIEEEIESLEIPEPDDRENVKLFDKLESAKQEREVAIRKTNKLEKNLLKLENNKEATEKWKKKDEFIENYPYEQSPDELFRKHLNASEVEKPEYEKRLNLGALKIKKEEIDKGYNKLTEEIARLKENNKTYKLHKGIISDSKEDIADTREELDKYKKLAKIYSKKGLPHFMVRDFLTNLQVYSNDYLKEFTNNRFSVEFKTTIEGRDNIEMVLYDSERGNKPRPYSTLSGGERMRVAVCIEVLGMKKTYCTLNGITIDTCLIDEVPWIDENGQKAYAQVMQKMVAETSVVCGVVCFESMGNYFENVKRVRRGKIVSNS